MCYSVGCGVTPWSDKGIFTVSIGTDIKNTNEAIKCIFDIILKNAKNKILFDRAKKIALSDVTNAVETLLKPENFSVACVAPHGFELGFDNVSEIL